MSWGISEDPEDRGENIRSSEEKRGPVGRYMCGGLIVKQQEKDTVQSEKRKKRSIGHRGDCITRERGGTCVFKTKKGRDILKAASQRRVEAQMLKAITFIKDLLGEDFTPVLVHADSTD